MRALIQSNELVDLCLVDFDYLVTKKKVEEEDDFMQLVNNHTRFETVAQGELGCGVTGPARNSGEAEPC